MLARRRGLESHAAEIVAPALEQREGRLILIVAQRASQQRQVLADQLLLQVDRVGRYDRAFAIGPRPGQRRHQVRERLAHAGAGLEEQHAAVVVRVHQVRGQVALALTILVAAQFAGDRTVLAEQRDDVERIERRDGRRLGDFDHHIQLFAAVVDDPESDAVVVRPRRNRRGRPSTARRRPVG